MRIYNFVFCVVHLLRIFFYWQEFSLKGFFFVRFCLFLYGSVYKKKSPLPTRMCDVMCCVALKMVFISEASKVLQFNREVVVTGWWFVLIVCLFVCLVVCLDEFC